MKRLINFYFLVILIGCVSELEEMKYPETKQDKITEEIFGKNIEDPYRWLEDGRFIILKPHKKPMI